MTFKTATYTGTGNQTLLAVSPTSNVYIFVKAGPNDKYNIDFKVDSAGIKRSLHKNRKGGVRIDKIPVPAAEVGLNITTNVSGDIIIETKEY